MRCSTDWGPTARSARTRTPSRSSAPTPTSTPRPTSSTTPRSPVGSPCRTCASGRTPSTPPTWSTAPASSAATTSACSTPSTCWPAPRTAPPCCSTPRSRPTRCGTRCPGRCSSRSSTSGCACMPSTPTAVARDAGLPGRTNTVLQTCFFAISGVLPADEAVLRVKEAIRKTYSRRGSEVVRRNEAAVDATLAALHEVPVPAGAHLGARDARHRAERRPRVRAHRDRRDDGRPRRRPPGQRDAGRRHLPERHHRLREAPHLRRRRGLGPRRLHPVRHLQLRVPAQRHPVEVLRRRRRSTTPPRASGRRRSTPPGCPARATPCRSTSRTAPAAACASRRAR